METSALRKRMLEKRTALVLEIARIDQGIAALDTAESILAGEVPPQRATRDRDGDSPAMVADATEEVLREAGRPMKRGALARALTARGLRLASGDPAKNLGTVLWRQRDRFENVPGRGYQLRDPSPALQSDGA